MRAMSAAPSLAVDDKERLVIFDTTLRDGTYKMCGYPLLKMNSVLEEMAGTLIFK
jgi:hypothetical protein